jgi:hypothetical protein
VSDRPDTDLDTQLSAISNDFVSRLDAMASGPALRAGLLRAAVSDLVWTLFYDMPDERYELADELEGLASAARTAISEEAAKARDASSAQPVTAPSQ